MTSRWIYTLAGPFATVIDDIGWSSFTAYWQTGLIDNLPAFDGVPTLVLSPDVVALLTALIGPPADGLPFEVVDTQTLTDDAWNTRPALSVVPFEALTPRWKVITVDGQSVLDKSLNTDAYPLTVTVGLTAHGERGEQVAAGLASRGVWPSTNRDPARLSILVMTGVTAMARATAMQIESRGYSFLYSEIQPFFADADILHTSNEVAFTPDCPPPSWVGEPVFCADPKYMTVLTDIGLDVVELTGNHINDWGISALSYTLDKYDANNIPYYGGGRDIEDGWQPAILTTPDGTRVAFVGCNVPGPYQAWATNDSPGAAHCEDDFATLTSLIQSLKANDQADVVVATLQYWELPQYEPTPKEQADFEVLAAAGADIVSGSQAHQPQGFSFANGSFIHYGPGNLFFDQMDFIENRQMFADKHVIYAGRHISTVLWTGLMEDYAQPNPMTPEDRRAFLQLIFEASGW
jgi:poly-gamma-glutamate synthesis protein (capsule biosynthesis protein)